MDCTPFIRTKLVMVTWLAVPIVALVGSELAVRSFHNQQCASYEQKKTLSEMAPRMQEKVNDAARFLKTYQVDHTGDGSAQDIYVGLLNSAAAKSGFTIETINLDQETLDDLLGTARIVMRLQGTGTCRQIAGFLKEIKQQDSLICENTLEVAPSGKAPGNLQINADFIKIYVE